MGLPLACLHFEYLVQPVLLVGASLDRDACRMVSYLAVCTHAVKTKESHGCCGVMDSETIKAPRTMSNSRRL